ncbi:hypothetical protein LSAT2_008897 [Lamellibrachia satsuma]|nr:hypothetical protein LSAT2_008897 [Lamellibrachia satsuma]
MDIEGMYRLFGLGGAENKNNVSFGTTLDREIYPMRVPPSKLGRGLCPIRGTPNVGPSTYNTEEYTNLEHQIKTFLTSTKGYTMNARTAKRFAGKRRGKAPAPNTYQEDCMEPRGFEPSYKPFSQASQRFPEYKRDVSEITPGPGVYPYEFWRDRRVVYQQAFGVTPIGLPTVDRQSTIPLNTDKLECTKETKRYYRRLSYLKLYYD